MAFYIYYFIPIVFLAGALLVIFSPFYFLISAKCVECRTRNLKRSGFCKDCGANLTIQAPFMENEIFDRKTLILSFFIPFLGLYQYFAYRKLFPKRARYQFLIGLFGVPIVALNLMGGLFGILYYGDDYLFFLLYGGF